eukprot:TRINITY_DN119526_c0_g1_i1.p2 TRINITY_DN119526_c0_g1~~TRINITY_DN119526_c0_g1_i1.p2  ORF type:complete len:109 (-),score=6.22 TRINITY_DN119526_c0_g1_i1:26-352(-)
MSKRAIDFDFEEEFDENSNKQVEKKQATTGNNVKTGNLNNKVEFPIDLGNKKKVSVSSYKGKTYINIREYFKDSNDGEDKPGKKGIALTIEQWRLLCDHIADINGELP